MNDIRIGEVVETLCNTKKLLEFFAWPPDAFALTSVLLSDSGAYRRVADPPKGCSWPPNKNWSAKVVAEGRAWRSSSVDSKALSGNIQSKIKILSENLDTCISDLASSEKWELCKSVLELHAFADEACEGVGIPSSYSGDSLFRFEAIKRLCTTGSLSNISATRLRVVPKLRTPQVGLSLRSLSHHLAIDRSEVKVVWRWHPLHKLPAENKTLNLVILPWPLKIEACSFKLTSWPLKNMNENQYGFFKYEPSTPFKVSYACKAIEKAKRKIGRVDGVILPESALKKEEIRNLEIELSKLDVAFFVTGVRDKKRNYAHLGLFEKNGYRDHLQDKHHRWLLDGPQILAYHLGSSLHPSRKYWEAIKIPSRKVNFICANEWLTMCHLICEDLARHDPVTQVVRAVGPNLVIALLLDGPQLGARWPGRYASVLADDPGSSVLTLTSLGMAKRSRPKGTSPSRVIALWKDATGGPIEIELGEGKIAAVLTLCAEMFTECTADGRDDGGMASRLVLSGYDTV